MSGLKSDLSALYRLEFYKNQRKWKLGRDMKPKRKTDNTEKLLNTTYSIDSDLNEKQAFLNDGFLLNPGERVPTHSQIDEPLSESVRLTGTPSNTLDFAEDVLEEISHSRDRYLRLEPERDDQVWSNAGQDHEAPLWQDAIDQEVYGDVGAGEGGCVEAVDLDSNTSPPVQQHWAHDRGEPMNPTRNWEEPYYPRNDHVNSLQSFKTEIEEHDSVDSFTEFSRGAHLAPHSSEVDLVLDTGNCTCSCTCSSLGRASEGELRARANAHFEALSTLFTEILLRNSLKMSNTTTCLHCPSPQAVLTEDRSLMNPLSVADTSLLADGRGRGRGRLRENRPIIRIGMGRPYRCT